MKFTVFSTVLCFMICNKRCLKKFSDSDLTRAADGDLTEYFFDSVFLNIII